MSAPWWEGELLAVDTETTGPDPESALLVSVTADLYTPSDLTPVSTLRLVVDPRVPIPDEAAEVHGITDEIVERDGLAPEFAVAEVVRTITGAWTRGVPVVAYNAAFDFTVLARESARHLGRPFAVKGPVVDPMVLDKAVDPFVKGANQRRLGPTCERYGITIADWHNATADAHAAALIARAIGAKHADKLPADLRGLWTFQRHARRVQAQSLTDYFARVGKLEDDGSPIVVDPSWPVREVAA